ncbi:hypothetical protein GGX14DRAFT_482808 [Mycena pura]|uniref:MYND-type domain-containing protein n=1 Tax=Mycena pura TaxID=153505 RepID=A0AAD6XWR3_9AGAR|nr:hypothetical protein GGX14DRAFT_482808 [Mycena pura]
MHPSLRLANLSGLSGSLRRLAIGAVRGSYDDIGALFDKLPYLPQSSLRLLGPVFYVTLDPADISTFHQLESSDASTVRTRLYAVLVSLLCITNLASRGAVPPEALHDLWPRIWSWIEFIETFRDNLPLDSTLYWFLYKGYIGFVKVLRENAEAHDQDTGFLPESSGMRAIISRAWRHALDTKEEHAMTEIGRLLAWDKAGANCAGPEHFDEFVSGAGSRTDLAALVVAQLRHSFPRPDSVATPDALSQLSGLLNLLWNAFNTHLDFRTALLNQGVITALTIVVRALTTSEQPQTDIFLNFVLQTLTRSLTYSESQVLITEALRAGLLRSLFSCGSRKNTAEINRYILCLLRERLPPCTVYFSVLSQLRTSLREVQDLDPVFYFARRDHLQHWQAFVDLVAERFEVVEVYRTGSLTALRACDNLECAKICSKRQLKRCSQCSVRLYCSLSCQKSDWRNEHRADCLNLRERHLAQSTRLSVRDMSFLRALMNHDYALKQEDIALDLLRFMHAHPSRLPHTRFDYSQGRCEVSIDRKSEDDLAIEALYPEDTARVRRSAGTMQMHLLGVGIREGQGMKMAWRMVSLRSASAEVYHGLRRIADSMLPPVDGRLVDLEPWLAKVRQLLKATMVSTH